MSETYLVHHGIKGQRWGVRRYQNFDGSYTQAGLQRYGRSVEAYNNAKSAYKATERGSIARRQAKIELKSAKKQMNKDYKHLKQDKLGDQGKQLYAEGHTITGDNAKRRKAIAAAAIGTIAVAEIAKRIPAGEPMTYLGPQLGSVDFGALARLGSVALGASVLTGMGISGAVQSNRDKKLRAYYAHSGKNY